MILTKTRNAKHWKCAWTAWKRLLYGSTNLETLGEMDVKCASRDIGGTGAPKSLFRLFRERYQNLKIMHFEIFQIFFWVGELFFCCVKIPENHTRVKY